jgi:uncharacterized membrane protein YccF (DUF307 family)
MRLILNLIWLVMGGFMMALGWWLAGIVMAISIIGIPWSRACFVYGQFCFFPFGREAIDRQELTGQSDIGTGAAGFIGNVIWFIVCGLWLCIGHLSAALANALTIIGIPFAIQHFKLAMCALAPIGKTIVTKEEAAAVRDHNTGAFPS